MGLRMERATLNPLKEPQKYDFSKPYTYEDWKRDLIKLTKQQMPNAEFEINDIEARKCYDSGMSTWQTFRENFRIM